MRQGCWIKQKDGTRVPGVREGNKVRPLTKEELGEKPKPKPKPTSKKGEE